MLLKSATFLSLIGLITAKHKFELNGQTIKLKGRAFLLANPPKHANKFTPLTPEMLNGGYWTILKHAYQNFGGIKSSNLYNDQITCLGNGWMIYNALEEEKVDGHFVYGFKKGFSNFCVDDQNCITNVNDFREELQFTQNPDCQESHLWVTNDWAKKLNDAIVDADVVDVNPSTEETTAAPTTEEPVIETTAATTTEEPVIESLCKCDGGTPVDDRKCVTEGSQQCASCETGFHSTPEGEWVMTESGYILVEPEIQSCEVNVCGCEYGTVKDEVCTYHNNNYWCKSCNEGYFLDEEDSYCKIIGNRCTCKDGMPVSMDECSENGKEQCASCMLPGWTVQEDGSCQLSINDDSLCKCDGGLPVSDSLCITPGSQQCSSCEFGYHTTPEGKWEMTDGEYKFIEPEFQTCEINECSCQYGTVKDEVCQFHNNTSWCKSCDEGYFLDEEDQYCKIIGNRCTCKDGMPVSMDECPENGKEQCASCMLPDWSVVENGSCQPAVDICELTGFC